MALNDSKTRRDQAHRTNKHQARETKRAAERHLISVLHERYIWGDEEQRREPSREEIHRRRRLERLAESARPKKKSRIKIARERLLSNYGDTDYE